MRATHAGVGIGLFFAPYAPTFLVSKIKRDQDACSTPVHAPIQVHTHRLGAQHRLKE
jgi:hypothetical protein